MLNCIIFWKTENTGNGFNKLIEQLESWWDLAILNLPNFVLAVLVFAVAYSLAKSSQKWVNIFLKNFVVQKAVRSLFAKILSTLIIAFGLFIALGVLNLDGVITSLLAGAGVVGLIIGLALQGPLANTFSGIFLAFEDVINVGDFIETNGYSGTVLQINLKSTKLKEVDNNIVVIPNKLVLESAFKNYSLTEKIRITIKCRVAYNSDLSEVKLITIKSIEELFPPLPGEKVEFQYLDLGNGAINFQCRFWIDAKAKIGALEAKSKAIITLKTAFDKHQIEIPFPTISLNN